MLAKLTITPCSCLRLHVVPLIWHSCCHSCSITIFGECPSPPLESLSQGIPFEEKFSMQGNSILEFLLNQATHVVPWLCTPHATTLKSPPSHRLTLIPLHQHATQPRKLPLLSFFLNMTCIDT